ncbi:MAG: phosphotriesterase [Bacteroidota bacterium]
MRVSRREFIITTLAGLLLSAQKKKYYINSVESRLNIDDLGTTLIHEHFLVDFIGADKISLHRWDRETVAKKVLPFILEAKQAGVKSIFDCTPNFLGRDVTLLQMLSKESGVNIITNTGYYGAISNKYLPAWAFSESKDQLAKRWIDEFELGIDNTNVRPGFIKIGVDAGEGGLSEIHKKLVRASGLTHLKTGLTICSHTGPGEPALEEISILKTEGVGASAFVWVHAQAEKDKTIHAKVAQLGSWVSLDGIGWGDFNNYADSIHRLKLQGLLHRVLISHDAGWYKPDDPGGEFRGYTNIFTQLIPLLKQREFSEKEIELLLVRNPAEAMGMRVRKG